MVYIVMGVSGCGKSTVGTALAARRGLPFYDGDDFHPAANVRKMRLGRPLTDDDRRPWLEDLASHIRIWNQSGGAVLACSALKSIYRTWLRGDDHEGVCFIWLKGSLEIIARRLAARTCHFMPNALLNSQIATLEEPSGAMCIELSDGVELTPEDIVDQIMNRLHTS